MTLTPLHWPELGEDFAESVAPNTVAAAATGKSSVHEDSEAKSPCRKCREGASDARATLSCFSAFSAIVAGEVLGDKIAMHGNPR